jgi:hypothetical protein
LELKDAINSKGHKTKGKGRDQKDSNLKNPWSHNPKGKGKDDKKKLPAWRYQREGTMTTMTKEGKTWLWCDHHGYWCGHKTSDCHAKKKLKSGKSGRQM